MNQAIVFVNEEKAWAIVSEFVAEAQELLGGNLASISLLPILDEANRCWLDYRNIHDDRGLARRMAEKAVAFRELVNELLEGGESR